MHIGREDLDEAVATRIVEPAQAAALWRFLEERHPGRARFTGLNVTYYLGSLVVIAAMGWLMTLGFQRLGPWAVCLQAIDARLQSLVPEWLSELLPRARLGAA
jgi:hypothetical protein